MPGLVDISVPTRRRRGSQDSLTDNDDASVTSSSSSKRRRLASSEDPTQEVRRSRGSSSPIRSSPSSLSLRDRSSLKHRPGSIVRLKLEQFVTYTSIELYPGPSLNVGIGPNGSGKSSLICGIVLGLGSPPSVLGRSKEITDYVKHGYTQATIEIELQGFDGQQNQTVKRLIDKEKGKSHWWVNGKSTNLKGVLELVKSFSIQVDNLCSVLPQDRVVEFAALSPVELLASTIRAAAPNRILEWHEQLKTLRNNQKSQQSEELAITQNLKNLERRQDSQRSDVQRSQERAEVKKNLALLEKCRPFIRYTEAKMRFENLKTQREKAKEDLRLLQHEVAPAMAASNGKKEYVDLVERVMKQKQKIVDRAKTEAENLTGKMSHIEEKITDCTNRREAERKTLRENKIARARVEADIKRLRQAIAEAPLEPDVTAYNANIREKQSLMRESDMQIQELRQERHERNGAKTDLASKVERAQTQLQGLKSQAGQQNAKLQRFSSDTFKAWQWIQQNQEKFEQRVYGPPIVECALSDKRYADMIESLFQRNDLLALTCTSRNDVNKLQEQLLNTLNLHDVTIRSVSDTRSQFTAPITDKERDQLGLTGWAIDQLTGPDPVLSMLCGEMFLHKTGVTLKDITNEQYMALERSPISSWVTSKSTYVVTRRQEYGPGASSTRVRDLRKANMWNSQIVDVRLENELRENLVGWQTEIEGIQSEVQELEKKIRGLHQSKSDLEEQKSALEDEKGQKQRAFLEYKALPTKLDRQEAKLSQFIESDTKLRELILAISDEETAMVIEKAECAYAHIANLERLRKFQNEAIRIHLIWIEAQSELETLKEMNASIAKRLEDAKSTVKKIIEDLDQAKADAKRMLSESQTLCDRDPEVEAYYQGLGEEAQHQSSDELEAEIESQRARLNFLPEANPGAIREYEDRQQRIDSLHGRREQLTTTLTTLENEIGSLRTQWEPVVDALIQRISEAFSKSFSELKCAGEVRLHKEEDFDQWAVHIYVKFREDENLCQLDNHRQSGGERSVSTIMYLMALQSLSRAPFRIVDEINQGMDPRNERMVHEMMVRAACPQSTSHEFESNIFQSFLITPKLLNNLKYMPGMTVHCIVSGEGVPSEGQQLQFKNLLKQVRELQDRPAELLGAA